MRSRRSEYAPTAWQGRGISIELAAIAIVRETSIETYTPVLRRQWCGLCWPPVPLPSCMFPTLALAPLRNVKSDFQRLGADLGSVSVVRMGQRIEFGRFRTSMEEAGCIASPDQAGKLFDPAPTGSEGPALEDISHRCSQSNTAILARHLQGEDVWT